MGTPRHDLNLDGFVGLLLHALPSYGVPLTGAEPVTGPGPMVNAGDPQKDPLAGLEQQILTDQLTTELHQSLATQDEVGHRLMASAPLGGNLHVSVTPTELLDLSGWFNRLAIATRRAETGTTQVTVGQGQDAISDKALAELLGADPDTPADATDPSRRITAADVLMALAVHTLQLHSQL